jgi:hypothetical protein
MIDGWEGKESVTCYKCNNKPNSHLRLVRLLSLSVAIMLGTNQTLEAVDFSCIPPETNPPQASEEFKFLKLCLVILELRRIEEKWIKIETFKLCLVILELNLRGDNWFDGMGKQWNPYNTISKERIQYFPWVSLQTVVKSYHWTGNSPTSLKHINQQVDKT